MDDTTLAERLARDLDGSFEALVHAHIDRCHAIALRVLGNPRDAEEVTQDALVRAYRALVRLRAGPDPRSPAPRLAGDDRGEPVPEPGPAPRAARDAAGAAGGGRRRARSRSRPSIRPSSSRGPSSARGSGRCSRALPERYRIPVVLRHVDDLSYAELSLVLGRPEGTLKAQVHRGLAMLRAAAAGTGLEEMTA